MSDTRERLIAVATQLFLEKGYSAVGTAEICQIGKLNKGTFYHFFASKSDLLSVVIGRYAQEFADAFEHIAGSDVDPFEKLAAIFEVPARANRVWQAKHGQAQGCLVGNMTLELGATQTNVQQAIREALRAWHQQILPVVAECYYATERSASSSPDMDAHRIIALIQGGLLMSKAMNQPDFISSMAPVAAAWFKHEV
jgi:TetR/AcrR family transcriptional regulator, transcriptional repressor for nem operon